MDKSYIPEGTKIVGNVVSDGDLSLSGEVVGDVSIEGTLELNGSIKGKNIKVGRTELTKGAIESNIECKDYIGIGKGVTVIGNIKAKNADIDGAVQGDLAIEEKVSVGNTAVIKGDVAAGEVAVALGAVCDVNLEKSFGQNSKAADFFKEYMESHGIKEKAPASKAKSKKSEEQ